MTNSNTEPFLRRMAHNWNDFWFKPGDPHTLCLMRVLTGIFVVYLHLAYTRDLETFFGKNGWVDLQLANKLRYDFPVYPPPSDWSEPAASMYLLRPEEKDGRRAYMKWLQSLPSDRAQRRETLAFFYEWMSAEPTNAQHALAFLQRLRIKPKADQSRPGIDDFEFVAPDERARLLDMVVNPPANAAERDKLLPPYFSTDPEFTAQARPRVRETAARVADSLPDDPKMIAQIIGHFAMQTQIPIPQRKSHRDPRSEFERTLKFIDEDLPSDLKERKEVLDYFADWGVDKRKLLDMGNNSWSIWYHVTHPAAMYVIHFVFIAVMVMFTLGLFTRVTSVLTWLAALCYVHRTSQVLFGMDVMMNICLIYMMLSPCNAVLSLDRWLAVRRARRRLEEARRTGGPVAEHEAILAEPAPSISANFVTRLYQVHFCFIYMAAGLAKLKGNAWWNHTATWGTIANPEFSPTVFAPYRWALTELSSVRWLWELNMSVAVVFTLVLEIGLPFMIWRPRLRPYLIIAGIFFHTGIATFMGLTVFGLFMMVLLMSYISPHVVRRWLAGGMRLYGPIQGGDASSAGPVPERVPLAAPKLPAKQT